MAAKGIDRRIQRTRKMLQDALTSMMVEKGYEATTVQDIIDRADVGRSTFYAHFADKQTLLTSRLDDLRAMLGERQRKSPGRLGFSLPMLEHARGHLPLYQAIVGRESGGFVLRRIHQTIADLAAVDLKALGFARAREQRELAAQFVAGAFMAVLTWWADGGAKLPPEDVDAIFRRLVMEGLAAKLGASSLDSRATSG